MNNLAEISDNVINFPTKSEIDRNTKTIKDKEYEKWSIEYHQNRWLDLFKCNESLADVEILTDNPSEILKIDADKYSLDWHNSVWNLLVSPTNSEELIRAREWIIDKVSKLPLWLKDKLYESRWKILQLNWFKDVFDHFEDLKIIIEELESGSSKNSALLSIFWTTASSLEDVRNLIPWNIQLVRNIWWEFFSKTADELSESFKKAGNFSLKVLKRIHKEEDYDSFNKLKTDVENFCQTYSHWDWILIVASWSDNGYIKTVESVENWSDYARKVKDPRWLLIWDNEKYLSHVENDLPNNELVEVYSWWNGSWKSTWLKTRLMLQLFYQTYSKVTAEDAKLIKRDQIVFINRWWSGYWEDLSAFWNDIKRKIMSFLPNLQNNSLLFLDEFWSTIPEKEAYYLIRALLDYLSEKDAKIYMATHNESYINWVNENKDSFASLYNFKSKTKKDGTMNFSYKLKEWKDSAHTLKIFKAAWMPKDILRKASWNILWKLFKKKIKVELPYKEIVSYSAEEKEVLKKKNKGFAGFTRYNEMVKVYDRGSKEYYGILRKYKPLWYDNRPNSCYHDEDLFFTASHPQYLNKKSPKISFDFKRYWTEDEWDRSDDFISTAKHLQSKWYSRKNIYSSLSWTLNSLTSWWLTSDVKELKDRQDFFDEIWNWEYEDANKIYNDINYFTWIINYFQEWWLYWWDWLVFDYNELSSFNKSYWNNFFEHIESYVSYDWVWRVCEWFLILVDMEEKLNNLPKDFKENHSEFLTKLETTIKLHKRYNRANKRTSKSRFDEYKTSAKLAEKVSDKVQTLISDLWWTEEKDMVNLMKNLHTEIDEYSEPVDVLELSNDKRSDILYFLANSRVFRKEGNEYWNFISGWFEGMTQIIYSLKWTWNLLTPLLDKLRSFESIHAQQLSNYIENFVEMPKVEDFLEIVKMKRENSDNFSRYDNRLSINRDHWWSALLELLWLIDIANQIKKLWWTKVDYNNTWEIDIKWMIHPWVKKRKIDQKSNDFYLWKNQSFNVLEWATMWWKTFNIQAVQWIIRLSQSIGYVPAESVTLPCFDGLIYIDRILEDEKNNLSAWQNDAKAWSEIILKMRKIVKEKANKWRYWFAIDEMISSVPARFQKGLVTALLEELTSLWQRWQISIHNPELVSKLVNDDPDSYKVGHPEVEFDENWEFNYTYKIKDWRSVDKNWEFTAYSLETAEKMWLPKEIIDRAREYNK